MSGKRYRTLTDGVGEENQNPLSSWIDKREKKVSDKICLFGKTFNYGTDDPLIQSLIAAVLRATWLAFGVFLLAYYNAQPGCSIKDKPPSMTAALSGLIILHFLGMVISIICAIFSTLGSLIRPKPRRGVIPIFHVIIFFFVAESCWLVFSMYEATTRYRRLTNECKAYKDAVTMFYAAVVTSWLLYSILILVFLFDVDPCGCCSVINLLRNIHYQHSESNDDYSGHGLHNNKATTSLWMRICCMWKLKLRKTIRTSMIDVVKSIGIIFGDFDATFSDLLAGFMLVKQYQKKLRLQGKSADAELNLATLNLLKHNGTVPENYETPQPTPLTEQEIEKFSVKFLHYMKFAIAVYEGFDTSNRWESFKILCKKTRGCICCPWFCKRRKEEESWVSNAAMISAAGGVPRDAIVTASSDNSVFKAPYFVIYNKDSHEIIVAVQGSNSIQDTLTNLSVATIHVPGLGGIDDAYVHQGFYKTASNIYKELMANDNFLDMLNLNQVDKFVFTGHSLGASVAVILSIMFKDHYKDTLWVNNIEAIGFCTPAATMNYVLAEKVQDFVTSIVVSNDIVTRATLRSLAYFKLTVETLLITVDTRKQQALFCSDMEWYQCCMPKVPDDEYLLGISYMDYSKTHHEDEAKVSSCALESHPQWKGYKGQKEVLKFLQNLSYQRSLLWNNPEQPMLFIPGRILHLEVQNHYRTTNEFGRLNGSVEGKWMAREALSAITVHPDMLEDHKTENVLKLLERLNRQQQNTN